MSIYTLCLFIALLAWCIGLGSAQRLQSYDSIVELRYDENKITADKIESILKNEVKIEDRLVQSIVAWEQTPDLTISNEILGKSSQVEVLNLYGDSHTLLPRDQLTGEHLIADDGNGCIISNKVADELWGSQDVIGKTVSYKEQDYVVRGVLKDNQKMMIVEAPRDAQTMKFSGLRVQFLENDNIKEKVRQFRGRYGLPEGVLIDLSLKGLIWKQLIVLPAWSIGIFILFRLYKIAYGMRSRWKSCMLWTGVAVVITIILMKITQFKVEIPIYFIPNQWSDFEFWSRTWREIQAERTAVETLGKYIPDMWRLSLLSMAKGGLVITGVTFLVAGRALEVKDWNSLFWNILMAILLSFIAIMCVHFIGIEATINQSIWIIWPCYIVLKFGLQNKQVE